ncbi:MAG: molybdopterin molybdotransferase MoeA [Thaumarchaeota archaeon]|nr:molybdopterin molybdotransferase MoeA [Nitrososphaerota archaeon]MCL5317983.1 molybdopterin molybdotransferase MoeA [Nitrososphaerota archaeon]
MPSSEIRYATLEEYAAAIRREVKEVTSAEEEVPLTTLSGLILAEDIVSTTDLPPYTTSLVDGYAVRAEDTAASSGDNPLIFKIIGKVELEHIPSFKLNRSEIAYIPTGAVLPEGANAVVKIEEATVLVEGVSIILTHPIFPGEHVTRAGRDVKRGQPVLHRGHRVRPEDLALLAAVRAWRIKTVKQPHVAILSIGDELTDIVEEVTSTRKYNGISAAVMQLVAESGCIPVQLGVAPDDEASIEHKIRQGLSLADAVFTIGGTSRGVKDFVANAVDRSGKPGLLLHGVDVVPGRVSGLGVVDGKPIVMLPGLMQSTIAAYLLIALPAIRRLQGLDSKTEHLQIWVPLSEDIRLPRNPFRKLLFVKLINHGDVTAAKPISKLGEASLIKPIVDADGFILLPPLPTSVHQGEHVTVNLLHTYRNSAATEQ